MAGTPVKVAVALALGFAIAMVTNLTWSIILALNLATTPPVPWGVVAMLLLLGGIWAYLTGSGPPVATRVQRASLLPRALLGPAGWAISLSASIGLLTFFLCALLLAYRLLPIPIEPLPTIVFSAPLRALIYFAMAAFVAGFAEEIGFRGYMQSMLDNAIGRRWSVAVVAVAFALLHGANSEFAYLVPIYLGTSLCLSTVVRLTGSVWPGIAAHALTDFASYLLLFVVGVDGLKAPFDWAKPDEGAIFLAVVASISLGAGGLALVILGRRREQSQRSHQD